MRLLLVGIIVGGKSIVDKKLNINASFVPIYNVSENTKGVVKDIIVEILARAEISNFKEVLSRVLSNRVGNIDNVVNCAVTNKVIIAGSFKKEVDI